MIRKFIIGATALVAFTVSGCGLTEQTQLPFRAAASASPQTSCVDTVSWDGRPPMHVMRSDWRQAQRFLDAGKAVNIGVPGYDLVAGHYSSHGSIFRTGPNLQVGDPIDYNCRTYYVTGREAGVAGQWFEWREGLTIQYSGCGSVCLVFAQ